MPAKKKPAAKQTRKRQTTVVVKRKQPKKCARATKKIVCAKKTARPRRMLKPVPAIAATYIGGSKQAEEFGKDVTKKRAPPRQCKKAKDDDARRAEQHVAFSPEDSVPYWMVANWPEMCNTESMDEALVRPERDELYWD